MTASRIESLVTGAGASLVWIDSPDQLPPASTVDFLVVDWGDRSPDWGSAIAAWRDTATIGAHDRSPQVILFGPHTDLVAHAEARQSNLGPMRARSAFFGSLLELLVRPEKRA